MNFRINKQEAVDVTSSDEGQIIISSEYENEGIQVILLTPENAVILGNALIDIGNHLIKDNILAQEEC